MSGLDLYNAALRRLPLAGPTPLHLPGGVEAQVGMSRPLLRQFADAEHLGPQPGPHRVQQVGQRRVI